MHWPLELQKADLDSDPCNQKTDLVGTSMCQGLEETSEGALEEARARAACLRRRLRAVVGEELAAMFVQL